MALTTTKISLDALPFPVFEEERAELSRFKEEAIQKEREIKRRKYEELAQLRRFVELRLSEIQAKKQIEELQRQQGALLRAAGSFNDGSTFRQHKFSYSHNSSFATQVSTPSPHNVQPQYHSSSPSTSKLQSHYHSPSPIVQQLQTQHHSIAVSPQPQSYPSNVVRPPGSTRRRLTWNGTSSTDQKWHKLTAMVKGFLTRRLFYSHKVQGLVKTIKDTSSVLLSLNDGSSSSNDVELYKRLDMQVQVARINLHRIFFESSITDKMAYIAHTRLLREERAFKKPVIVKEAVISRPVVSHHPRQIKGKLSSATKKSMERRKQRSMMMPGRTVNRKTKNTS